MTRFFPLLLILSITFFSCNLSATEKGLVGDWKGKKISLNLRANNTYAYKMKVLKFKGNYTVKKNVLTLHYTLAGFKKKRTATFKLQGNTLILTQEGKEKVVLTRQK